MCVLGNRLIKDIEVETECHKNFGGPLHKAFCTNWTGPATLSGCEPYYEKHELRIINGIKGLRSGVLKSKYFRSKLKIKYSETAFIYIIFDSQHLGKFSE